nr:hypothetical protein BDOA9_0162340 [Bradyrhizobium sp. DOA9]
MKPAYLTVLGPVLVQKRKTGLIEFVEKLVPADAVESLIRRIEIDPQDAGVPVLFRRLDRRRLPATFVDPFADCGVIGGLLGFAILRHGRHVAPHSCADPAMTPSLLEPFAVKREPARFVLRRTT